MPIIDLSPEHEQLFFQCLEDWSADMAESGTRREEWYRAMLPKGLRVKLAMTEEGVPAGFIQYLLVRESTLIGQDGYFVCCIWVHGHKSGRGNLQKRGLGKALLKAAEDDVKALGGKGIAAWGLMIPIWMKAAWFKKHGYHKVDRDGIAALMWKPLTADAKAPAWRKQLKKPLTGGDKLRISIFSHGWCSVQNIAAERIRRVAAEFSDQVILDEYDTMDRSVMDAWGLSDAIFLDGRQIVTGPPPSYEKLRKLVLKRLR